MTERDKGRDGEGEGGREGEKGRKEGGRNEGTKEQRNEGRLPYKPMAVGLLRLRIPLYS